MKYYLLSLFLISGISINAAEIKKATISAATPAPAFPDRILKYYEIGKTDGPVLYTQKIQYQKLPSGELNTKSVVTDPKGKLIYTEVVISKGSQLISQTADVEQTKRRLSIEVKDEHVIFKTSALYPENKEEPKEDSDKLPEHFITGALAEPFVMEHFTELMAGDTVHAKMGILELRELLSFKFWKKEMIKMNDHEVMVVAMKPSSIFISLLLKTIYLYIDTKDKKMIHYVGRTPLWKEEAGSTNLNALDAEIVFEK